MEYWDVADCEASKILWGPEAIKTPSNECREQRIFKVYVKSSLQNQIDIKKKQHKFVLFFQGDETK